MREPIARLVKNGEERLVHSRAELVELRYDGWRLVKEAAASLAATADAMRDQLQQWEASLDLDQPEDTTQPQTTVDAPAPDES